MGRALFGTFQTEKKSTQIKRTVFYSVVVLEVYRAPTTKIFIVHTA